RLGGGLSVNRLIRGEYVSFIRNKQIAAIFKEAGITEKYGSGIKRILGNPVGRSSIIQLTCYCVFVSIR
ncbi:MAG: ATP-binding protein, partial [Pseudomonadota bacterium]